MLTTPEARRIALRTKLERSLGRNLPDIEFVPEVDSTNSELVRRGKSGRIAPTVLVAERQTAGRGRLGRSWDATPTQVVQAGPLLFSVGLPLAPSDWSGLSVAVGISVAESLDPSGRFGVRLKWPNDLWVADRKLCGILVETLVPGPGTNQRFTVIGIGINIGPISSVGMRTPPTWLQEWRPEVSADEVLADVLPGLLRDLELFCSDGFGSFQERYSARDALSGRDVDLSDGTAGRCEGVSSRGELLVRNSDGLTLVTSSEVSVRPRSPT